MKKCLIGCVASFFALVALPAYASSWNYVPVGNGEVAMYFDAASVEKTTNTVTVWVKAVQVNEASADGSWAIAFRWRADCPKRTIQSLASYTYDAKGDFISSAPGPFTADAVIPDSAGESLLNLFCEANFPNDRSGNKYIKLKNNDVFQTTKDIAELTKKSKDLAPQ